MTRVHTTARTGNIPVEPTFLRLPDVMRLTGLARSTIYRLVAAGGFPRPVRLAARAVAWRDADISEWSASRLPTGGVPYNAPVPRDH